MLRYGAAVGLLSCVALFISSRVILSHPQLGLYLQLTTVLLLVGGIYAALRRHFADHEITMLDAIRIGLGVGLISSAMTAAFTWLYATRLDPHYLDTMALLYRRTMVERGYTPAEVERAVAQMRTGFSIRNEILANTSRWLTISVVLSAVMGRLFRRPGVPGKS